MTTDPLPLVRAFYEGLSEGAMHFELIDTDVRWRTPATLPWTLEGQPEREGIAEYRGLEQLGRYLQAIVESVDGMVAWPETFLVDGDRVVVLGRECGTARKTGQVFSVPFAHVLRVERGRITDLHGYTDTAMLAQAVSGSSGRHDADRP